jgi:uncharacterized membrane-anchored protein YhcB (DUF1043 family)
VCPTVFVRPAYISAVAFTSTLNITAGLPSMLILQTSDRFGNPVFSGGSTATIPIFTAIFTRSSGAAYVVTSNSVYTGPTSYAYVPIAFDADGVMNVLVFLPADTLDPTSFDQIFETTIVVQPAACAAADPTRPYRCPSTRECVDNYGSCPGYTACNGVICPGTTNCVTSFASCNTTNVCTNGTVFCATGVNTGYCTLPQTPVNASEPVFQSACPLGTQDNFCVYQGLVHCGNGICRQSLADCPSLKVCPPYTFICPDGASCAVNLADCPPLPTVSCAPPLPFQCRDSRCVGRAEDCSTEKTCPGTQVVCPDGSCQRDASNCTETFSCLFAHVKCPNGECRQRLQDCPSSKTCAPGFILCENGGCRATATECDQATQCPNGVRCPDGTCRPNRLQCPTIVTCPVAFPVLCADGSCVRDVARCPSARVCPPTAPFLCPDNSCTMYPTTCPTTLSCPIGTPTLCPDGTCVDILDNCPLANSPPSSCPPYHPHRCADGTCVGKWSYCPTKQVKCFDYAPVLCPDHRCVSSVEMCLPGASVPCPAGQTRCPNGGCAWSRALCPTQLSCGPGFVRGTDGSCKLESLLSGNTSTIGTVTVGASPNCPPNQIICPQNHQGYSCANSLADCPQDITCPRNRPIRCSDASCAMSYEDCYPVVPVTGSTIACPGSASTSSGLCGASTTCPSYAPSKCWDESCRVLPEDCPPQANCDSANYFLCSNGQCTSSPLSCTSGQKCNLNGLTVKCPWAMAGVGQCVANVTQCANLFTDRPQRTCPDSYSRCREGYCSLDSSRCTALACPSHVPFVCPDGLCARNPAECNADNGCPYDESFKCADGSCVSDESLCPATIAPCPDVNFARCLDGSCPDILNPCRTATGCDEDSLLCADGQCSLNPASCTDTTDNFNACPAYRPFRCADGFCAMSAYLCPIIPLPVTLAVPKITDRIIKSIRCADGSQVAFAAQCPTIRPCAANQVRCPNGQCRKSLSLCPLSSPCSLLFPASDLGGPAGVRCPTGHCAPSLEACIDETTGCPDIASYKCNNGQCVIGPTQCPDDLPLLAQPANGCPIETPFKCIDGSCNADPDQCPAANGCPWNAPFLCANGQCLADQSCPASTGTTTPCASGIRCPNGQCQASWDQCAMSNGCPVGSPVRCANGECKKFPARGNGDVDTCPVTIVCDASHPFKCVDNTCVSNPQFCRAVSPCPITAPILCPGFLCQSLANATCATTTQCPSQSPVLCPDGACTLSVAHCSSRTAPPCAVGQIRCFDGQCRDKPLDCAAAAFQNYQAYADPANPKTFSNTGNHQNGTCAQPNLTLCPDGTCVQESRQCGFVSACPTTLPLRCSNGACINATVSTCEAIGECSAPNKRCEDGLCRSNCLSYSGCSLKAPYACFGRRTPCTTTQAACVSGSGFAHRRRLLQLSSSTGGAEPTPTPEPTPDPDTPQAGQEACVNCESNVVAATQIVQLSPNTDQWIDVSVDAAAVPRTQLHIPAGTFGGQASQITIVPIPSSTLDFPVSPVSESSMPQGPFHFSTNILSTPFHFAVDNPKAPFLSTVTVLAAIDNMIYDPFAPSGTVVQKTVPCEIQGPTFTITPDASVYVPGGSLKYACSGSLALTSTGMRMSMDASCESINIEGRYIGQGGAVTQLWDGTSSTSCDCFNITSSSFAQPSPLPPFPPRNVTHPWARYQVDKLVCLYVTRTQSEYSMAIYTDPARAGVVCPFRGKEPNALFYTMKRDGGDGCGGSGVGGNRVMNPNDICLATYVAELGTFACVQSGRAERLANPTWYPGCGRPQNRVAGRIRAGNAPVLAFAYIPLPPEPAPATTTCDLWCQHKWVIIGVIIGLGAFILCMGYVISRFMRYRAKYREQKKHVEQLREYAREIDELRGGIGVYEEDVDMMTNPMVVEMKNLDRQLNEANAALDTQQEKDTRTIEQLSQDRERLHAEIQRVKVQMQQQRQTTATRMEDIHVSQAHVPAPASSTSGLVPMEMEGPSHEDAASSGASGQERHGFAQVRRPAKKKEDF